MRARLDLRIEGKIIEVPDSEIDMDYQITDIATMGAIDSAKSFPISVPLTPWNNRAFQHLHDISLENDLPRRKLGASLSEGGEQLLEGGTARIKKTGKAYEVELGGGNFNLLDAVKDLKLSDLDWSEYDHFWTLQNVYDSRNNTEGFIYLASDYFIDYPTAPIDNTNRSIRADYLYPAVFVHTIIKKIGEYCDIKLTGELLDNSDFKRLAIPFSDSQYIRNNDSSRYLVNFTLFGNAIASNPIPVVALYTFVSSQGNYFTSLSNANYDLGVIYFADNVDITLELVLNVDKLSAGSGTLTIFFDFADGLLITQEQRTIAITTGTGQYTLNVDLSVLGVDIAESLMISFQSPDSGVLVLSTSTVTVAKANIRAGDDIVFSNTLRSENYVTLSSALPDISCGELLKALGNMFGQLFQFDALTNTVRLEPIRKVYQNRGVAYDWTEKIDLPSTEAEYELGNYGQTNKMLLDNPDGMDPLYGSFTFPITHEHLEAEREVFKLPFQYTDSITLLDGLPVAYIPVIEAEENEATGEYLYSLGGNSKARILVVEHQDVTADPLEYSDGTNTLSSNVAPTGYFSRKDRTFNLDLNSLTSNYLSERIAMLQKSRKVTLDINLSSSDIAALDFFRPVYIRPWGKYYFINRISRQGTGLSKVVLVEL